MPTRIWKKTFTICQLGLPKVVFILTLSYWNSKNTLESYDRVWLEKLKLPKWRAKPNTCVDIGLWKPWYIIYILKEVRINELNWERRWIYFKICLGIYVGKFPLSLHAKCGHCQGKPRPSTCLRKCSDLDPSH